MVPGATEGTGTSAMRNSLTQPVIDAIAIDDATNPSSHTKSLSGWRVSTASKSVVNNTTCPLNECRITDSTKHTTRRASSFLAPRAAHRCTQAQQIRRPVRLPLTNHQRAVNYKSRRHPPKLDTEFRPGTGEKQQSRRERTPRITHSCGLLRDADYSDTG